MNYFTKEWYELNQKSYNHLSLEEDKRAEIFSEEYFQQLYDQELTEFLNLEKKVAHISHKPFKKEKLIKQFEKNFISHQEHIKTILPKEILINIADIRVYVLDKASPQVVKDVTQFCENNKKLVYSTIDKYNKYCKEALMPFDKGIVEDINFHDCLITKVKQTEKSFSIVLDNSSGFTHIYEIQFENYKIIKQDDLLEGAWWLYEEVYMKNGKYELHTLLDNKNMNLIEFTISAEHISFKYNKEK